MNPTSYNSLPGVTLLLQAIEALRHPVTGCPWDLAQTHESLIKYFREELEEFLEELVHQGPTHAHTWEELGDVCLQVLLHCRLAEEKGYTNFDAVCQAASEKIKLRHPHVFDPDFPRFKTPDEVQGAWEQIKARAKQKTQSKDAPSQAAAISSRADHLSKVPRTLPALNRASRIGEKAAAYAFDWPTAEAVLDKVREEIGELIEASAETSVESPTEGGDLHAQEEFGDLLFALAQYARKRRWDPELLVAEANEKFLRRFSQMEGLIEKSSANWDLMNLEDLEAFWQKTKALTPR